MLPGSILAATVFLIPRQFDSVVLACNITCKYYQIHCFHGQKKKGAHNKRDTSVCVYLYKLCTHIIYISVVYEVKNGSSRHAP